MTKTTVIEEYDTDAKLIKRTTIVETDYDNVEISPDTFQFPLNGTYPEDFTIGDVHDPSIKSGDANTGGFVL